MKQKSLFGNFYSPYQKDKESTMDDWYEAHKNDPEKMICIDGQTYCKIIHRCEFYGKEDNMLLVALEPNETIRTDDILADENDRCFTVKMMEHFYIRKIPEWMSRVVTIVISGENCEIGEYLCKKDAHNNQGDVK